MSAAPAIAVERLAKVFGGLRAVDNVSLSVAAGERRALIGPNGAGKTTLFHCIAGTLQPSDGQVRMFGTEITTLAEHRRTGLGMGRTFQILNVCTDLTVMENLTLAILGADRRKWIMYKPARAADQHARGTLARAAGRGARLAASLELPERWHIGKRGPGVVPVTKMYL